MIIRVCTWATTRYANRDSINLNVDIAKGNVGDGSLWYRQLGYKSGEGYTNPGRGDGSMNYRTNSGNGKSTKQ